MLELLAIRRDLDAGDAGRKTHQMRRRVRPRLAQSVAFGARGQNRVGLRRSHRGADAAGLQRLRYFHRARCGGALCDALTNFRDLRPTQNQLVCPINWEPL